MDMSTPDDGRLLCKTATGCALYAVPAAMLDARRKALATQRDGSKSMRLYALLARRGRDCGSNRGVDDAGMITSWVHGVMDLQPPNAFVVFRLASGGDAVCVQAKK